MIVQTPFKTILFISLLFSAACSQNKNYHDNSALEKPPELEIIPVVTAPVVDNNVDTGLGEAVKRIDATHLSLKQPYEQAWNTMETVLEFSRIKITDRNREKGEYFINYDPDNARRKESDLLDDVGFFLFKDEYAEAPYKVTITKNEQSVEITAEKLNDFQMDLLDDGEEMKFDDKADDGSSKLIRYLYGTLKNDLPLD